MRVRILLADQGEADFYDMRHADEKPQFAGGLGDPLVHLHDRRADPSLLTVADVMTRDPTTADEGKSVANALRTMRRIGMRRLPVVGSKGLLTGILALDDVLDVLANELAEVSGAIRNEQHIEGVLRS